MKWVLAIGCVVAAGTWLAASRSSPVGRAVSAVISPVHGRGPCALSAGQRGAWRIARSIEVPTGLKSLLPEGAVVPPQLSLRAVLDAEVLRAEASGAVVLCRLHQIEGDERGEDLASPFLIRVDRDCGLSGFARGRRTALAPARAQQAALHELWFKLPVGREATASGRNGDGEFTAVLRRGNDARGPFVQRQITKYTRSYAGSLQGLAVKRSRLTVRYGKGPWFDAMEGEEALAGLSQARTRLTVTSRPASPGALAKASRDQADYVWEDLLASQRAVAARFYRFTADERRAQAAQKQVPFGQALDRLAKVVDGEQSFVVKSQPTARWLEAHRDLVATYAAALLQPQFPKKLDALGFAGLAYARVPEARTVLLEIRANPKLDPWDRVRATFALLARDDVGLPLAQSLSRDAKALGGTGPRALYGRHALLGLGMMAGLRGGRDPEIQALARATVKQLLARHTTPGKLSPVFGAIGNMGDPSLLPIVDKWSHNESAEIRAQVSHAIRRLTWARSGRLIIAWLRRETSPEVKAELYGSIRAQLLNARAKASPELVAEGLKDLAAQPRPLLRTRHALSRILGPAAASSPEVRRALARQAVREVGTKSGLYNVLAQHVPAEEMARALREAKQTKDKEPRR